jgi:type IV pilus assembly protein PilF
VIKISHFILLIMSLIITACTGGQDSIKDGVDHKSASETNLQLGVGYIQRGELEIAKEKLLKSIEQDSENVDAFTTMAYLMMQLKQMEEAENYYLEALDVKSNKPETHNSYGTFLCRLGRIDEAMEHFIEAYSNPFYNTPYLAYSNAGSCLLGIKSYTKAEIFLRKALKEKPKLANALISMAEVGADTKRYMMARAYVQRYHAVSKPTAESLWVQVQAEKALGAEEHFYKYAKQLLNDFPDSKQAVWVEKLARDNGNRRN